MHIVVCIKQVPDSAQIRVHPVTNTIMRQGVPTIINPYDLFALEEALRLRDKFGGEVTVLTMGPPMAEDSSAQGAELRRRSRRAVDRPLLRRLRHAGDDLCAGARRSARSARYSARRTSSSPASRRSTATPRRSVPASPSGSVSCSSLMCGDRRVDVEARLDRQSSGAPKAACRYCARKHALPDHHARRLNEMRRGSIDDALRAARARDRQMERARTPASRISAKCGLRGSPTDGEAGVRAAPRAEKAVQIDRARRQTPRLPTPSSKRLFKRRPKLDAELDGN